MSSFAAILTSDPSLVRCELDRVRAQLTLDGATDVGGVGAYEDNQVLQRHYGMGVPRTDMWEVPDSDAVVLHTGALPLGHSLEHNAQPFRFRQWLWAQVGSLDATERVRERLLAELPDFLQRSVRGVTLSEVLFGVFLSELRGLGRIEDPNLEAAIAAQLLVKTTKIAEQASTRAGGTQRPSLALVATNGRILAAMRRGAQPLVFKLLEGDRVCERHGLKGDESDALPEVRDHRRRRSVVVATDPARADSWVQVQDGGAIAVDRKLSLQVL